MTMASTGVGFLDGNAIIKMNNLAVGYFPSEEPSIGVYPVPTVVGPADEQITSDQLQLPLLVTQVPAQEQHSGTNS